jgi:hypothetical protein
MLLARGTAHFSLVAAAPLPIFVLLLMRTAERERWRDAVRSAPPSRGLSRAT